MYTHLYQIIITIIIIIIIIVNKQDNHKQHYNLEKKITKILISSKLKKLKIISKIILKFQTK